MLQGTIPAAGGEVTDVGMLSSTLATEAVEDCVLDVARRLAFPAPPAGRNGRVWFPLVFERPAAD